MIDVTHLKEKSNIVEVARKLGLEPKGYGDNTHVLICLWHEDKKPSLVLEPKVNRYHCLGCGEKGDVLNLIQKVNQCGFKEAVHFLDPTIIKANDADYLESRGISLNTAAKFGLITLKDRIVIPLETGEKFRMLTGEVKYTQKPGTEACLFKTSIPDKKAVILTEGEFDAILVHQNSNGQFPCWTSSGGAETFKEEWVKDFSEMEKIYIAYDNDDAGERGAQKVAQLLGLDRCFRLSVPKMYGKDWTDYFLAGQTIADFSKLVLGAPLFSEGNTKEWFEEIEKSRITIKSGFENLDRSTGGFDAGNTYVVSGLNKSGKSTFLMNIIENMLEAGIKVGFIDTEMNKKQFMARGTAIFKKMPEFEARDDSEAQKEWVDNVIVKGSLFYSYKKDLIDREGKPNLEITKKIFDDWIAKGAQVLVFDNFTTIQNGSEEDAGWKILARFLNGLIDYTKVKKVVLFVVLHTKGGDLRMAITPDKINKIIEEKKPEKIFEKSITINTRPNTAKLYGGQGVLSQISGGVLLLWRPFQDFNDPSFQRLAMLILEDFRVKPINFINEIQLDFEPTTSRYTELLSIPDKKETPWYAV